MPLILNMLAESRARRDNQARETTRGFEAGTTYGRLSPEQQRAYRRATGRKTIGPDEVVSPVTDPRQLFTSNLRGQLNTDPVLARNLALTFGVQTATGQATPLSTPAGVSATASANTASAQNAQSLAEGSRTALAKIARGEPLTEAEIIALSTTLPGGATPGALIGQDATGRATAAVAPSETRRRTAENTLQTELTTEAQGALNATRAGTTPTNAQIFGAAAVTQIVPSEAVSRSLTADARQSVMRAAAGFLADPNNSSVQGVFREMGISVADAIGASVAGVGTFLDQGLQQRNIILNSDRQARNIALEAATGLAQNLAEKMGGRFSVEQVRAVIEGRAPNNSTSRTIQSFLQAGFDVAMTGTSLQADPAMALFGTIAEIMRNPRIAQDRTLREALTRTAAQVQSTAIADRLFDRLDTGQQTPENQELLRSQFRQHINETFRGIFTRERGGSYFGWLPFGEVEAPLLTQPGAQELPQQPTPELQRIGDLIMEQIRGQVQPQPHAGFPRR